MAFRRAKHFRLFTAIISCVLLILFYNISNKSNGMQEQSKHKFERRNKKTSGKTPNQKVRIKNEEISYPTGRHSCSKRLRRSKAKIETVKVLPTLNFDASWMESGEFWNDQMEERFELQRNETWPKVNLKVIVMPHSHNDPGWLKTYEEYFNKSTRTILDNAVDKLTKFKDATFIWTEMSFLSLWYEEASYERRSNFHQLLKEGRLEVLTGGWVMTDEANVELFGMVHQLTEGHQWLLNHLNITAKASWSCDPFGHSGTFPYVLKASGIDSMVIMRIHYAWKEWFAEKQQGNFLWRQQWEQSGKHDILALSFPYDIYSIKGSCGPHQQTCEKFDFARHRSWSALIHPGNIKEKAELLLTQYGKTGSLFQHNVVLVPLGSDFTYFKENEWDSQYNNYKLLMEYINKGDYNADVRFGTLSDYFAEVRKRTSNFDTLNGDFHVYSDVFSDGRPAYWSGYYTTRPFMKKLSRELDCHLRSTEILYTYALNRARQLKEDNIVNHFVDLYKLLLEARQNLALFQHHDAITETSKEAVIDDYGLKLYVGIINCRVIEKTVFQYLMTLQPNEKTIFQYLINIKPMQNLTVLTLYEDFEQEDYYLTPTPRALDLQQKENFIMVFNPLAQDQHEVVSVFLEADTVCLTNIEDNPIKFQLTPTWSPSLSYQLNSSFVKMTFIAKLPALSITKFRVKRCANDRKNKKQTEISCIDCSQSNNLGPYFHLSPLPSDSIHFENSEMELTFDKVTFLLASIRHKPTGQNQSINLKFSTYPTKKRRNGGLFKTDEQMDENVDIFNEDDIMEVLVIRGSIFWEVNLIFESGISMKEPGIFVHTIRLYNTNDRVINKGIYIENKFNFGAEENHEDLDLFMRIKTDVKNGDDSPEFYTDMNGFQMQRRTIVSDIKIEGNIYPITTMAYIEDNTARVTLVVDHAQAATSWQQGWLEAIVDRRAIYHDNRGMGEGICENQETLHKYWLLFEPQRVTETEGLLSVPSQLANRLSRMLNNPVIHYIGNNSKLFRDQVLLISEPLHCDIHLFNLRTLSDKEHPESPSRQSLLVMHRQASDCDLNYIRRCDGGVFNLTDINVRELRKTSLTGVLDGEELKSLEEANVEPMTLEAVKLIF